MTERLPRIAYSRSMPFSNAMRRFERGPKASMIELIVSPRAKESRISAQSCRMVIRDEMYLVWSYGACDESFFLVERRECHVLSHGNVEGAAPPDYP